MSITLSLSRKVDKTTRLAEVYIRLNVSHEERPRAKTGIFVPANRWSARTGQLTIPKIDGPERDLCIERQQQLLSLCDSVLSAIAQAPRPIDRRWLEGRIQIFHGRRLIADNGWWPVYEVWLKSRNVTKSTYYAFLAAGHNLQLYEQAGGNAGIGMTDMDLRGFASWLAGKASPATVRLYLHAVHAWLKDCEGAGLGPAPGLPRLPAQRLATPWYLTLEERDRLASLPLDGELAKARDAFILQCHLGCRWSDLVTLDERSCRGNLVEYVPRKTARSVGRTVRVPMTSTARRLLAELPQSGLNIHAQNRNLRIIAKMAGLTRRVTVTGRYGTETREIWEVISTHCARRTFIGNLYKQVRDPEIIAAMSGHAEGSKAFARYREIDDEIKADTIKLLE